MNGKQFNRQIGTPSRIRGTDGIGNSNRFISAIDNDGNGEVKAAGRIVVNTEGIIHRRIAKARKNGNAIDDQFVSSIEAGSRTVAIGIDGNRTIPASGNRDTP